MFLFGLRIVYAGLTIPSMVTIAHRPCHIRIVLYAISPKQTCRYLDLSALELFFRLVSSCKIMPSLSVKESSGKSHRFLSILSVKQSPNFLISHSLVFLYVGNLNRK